MAVTPRDRVDREKAKVEGLVDAGTITESECDALLAYADALDKEKTRHKIIDEDGDVLTYEPRSVEAYLQSLRLCLERGLDVFDTTADAFNAFIDGQHDDRGLTKSTLVRYQCAGQAFFRFNPDIGVDPNDIHVYKEQSAPKHDEQDMFTADEVDALREACNTPRDRAFLELLIYTGQRITALRTLRRGDADVDAGYLYLNDEADGLKGALSRGRKRPMFGARKYVRDWKTEYHPVKDSSDHPLFVGDPDHHKTKLDEPWSEPAVRKCFERIAERAGVEKPVNPHNFRHYFVTVMKRDYQMDNDTLRMLLGTRSDSAVLDTTYSHVTDEDYISNAEAALGYGEDDDASSPLTPETCPTCGEILEDHWRRCPSCDELFASDLQQLQSEADETRNDSVGVAVDPDAALSSEQREGLRSVLDVTDDAEIVAEWIESEINN